MARDTVFLDTSALLAQLRPHDGLHQAAKAVSLDLEKRRSLVVTSDWVIAEFLNAAADSWLRGKAMEMIRVLYADADTVVIAGMRKGFFDALDLYESRPDKAWSLVDCSSILICRERRIKRVFTHDRHFKQAGFQILL